MNLPLMIARRLQLRPEEGRRLSPGIVIATTGIAVSVVVMLFTIAIVTGFKHQIREKVEGFDSQITIRALDGSGETVAMDSTLKAVISGLLPENARVTPALLSPAILKTDDDFSGIVLKSFSGDDFIAGQICEAPDSTVVALRHGQLPDNEVVLSRFTARRLGLEVGDKVFVHFVNGDNIKTRRLTVGALYDTSFNDYDSRLAFASPSMMRKVGRLDADAADVIEINGLEDADIRPVTEELQRELVYRHAHSGGTPLNVDNVYHTGAMYLNWLDLLDTNVVVILVLMALVAGFTLVSSTFIIILERVSTIGILKTLGMTDGSLRRVFTYMGMKLVGWGMLIGNAVGLSLLKLQEWLHPVPLDAESYFLEYVPVEFNVGYILLLNAAVIAISAIVLLVPTKAVCRISPAQTVNYSEA